MEIYILYDAALWFGSYIPYVVVSGEDGSH